MRRGPGGRAPRARGREAGPDWLTRFINVIIAWTDGSGAPDANPSRFDRPESPRAVGAGAVAATLPALGGGKGWAESGTLFPNVVFIFGPGPGRQRAGAPWPGQDLASKLQQGYLWNDVGLPGTAARSEVPVAVDAVSRWGPLRGRPKQAEQQCLHRGRRDIVKSGRFEPFLSVRTQGARTALWGPRPALDGAPRLNTLRSPRVMGLWR
jgi:hypothetical protein